LRVSIGPPASIVNITVHGIGPTERDLEPDEDRTWITVGQFETLLDLVADQPLVRISFDDGNASDVRIALPRLLERGLRAEFFVLAGLLGRPGRLNADDLKELVAAGMGIGSHGWAHRDWRRISPDEAGDEFERAADVIGEVVGREVATVAVPFGSYDRHVLRRLRRAKVRRVYTSDGGWTRPGRWLQARNSIRHDSDAAWVAGVLGGRTGVATQARQYAARTVKRMRGKP
jgi:peptidoglycan/xylan/chitin deacetylase (PgdA/CDA1 family)